MNFFHHRPPHSLRLDFQSSMRVSLCQIFDLTKLENLLEDLKEPAQHGPHANIQRGHTQKINATANAILIDIYELLLNAAEMSIKNFNDFEIQSRIEPLATIDQKTAALLEETLPLVVQKIKALPVISEKFLLLDFFAGERFSHDKLIKAVALPHVITLVLESSSSVCA